MRPLLALPLLALLAAGCLTPTGPDVQPAGQASPGLSEARYAILPPEEVWVASSVDGKRLNNAVFRPDTDEPVPVWINFSPYWGDTALEEGDPFAQYLIHEYVPRGYAVVLSAVRGTGHSEGCFQIAGDLEVQDAYDVIDFFSQEPWSSGSVGAGGKSYDSTTQNGVLAKLPHPALKTTFHVSGITDFYRYNYRFGVPYPFGGSFNTRYYLTEGLDEYGIGAFGIVPNAAPERLTEEDPESLARIVDDLACPEFAEMTASGFGTQASGVKDAYWVERDWNRAIGSSATNTSIFFVHGLQDWNVKPDHILPWLQSLPEGVEVKGWLHQWERRPEGGHVYPMRTDWNLTMLRWMDHWLKGIDTGVLDEPRFEVQGTDGLWRSGASWPPPPEELREIGLDGFTATTADTFTWAEATVLETREKVRASGVPLLTVRATSLQPDPVLTAVLWDLAPNGTRTWVNEAVLRGALRDSLEQPSPVTPGQALDYTLEFYPMDAVLEPGHQWVLGLGAPTRFARPEGPQMQGITYDATATLALPLAPTDTLVAPQPEPMDCFAC